MLAPEFINKILEKLELKKPCQAGYEQIGMKMKDGKKVPNCVPIEAKEELSNQKVELGVEDYDRYRKDLFKIDNELRKIVGEYASLKKQMISIRQRVSKESVKASQILKEAESQVKKDIKSANDLGVNPSLVTKPFQETKKEEGEIQRIAERIIQATKSIK